MLPKMIAPFTIFVNNLVMLRKTIYISLVFLLGALSLHAQDSILFMSGRMDYGAIVDTSGPEVKYNYKDKKGRLQLAEIEKERIFSIIYSGGQEVVLYQQDTAGGDDFTELEMRYFIMGEQDADKGYKSPIATVGAVAAGVGGGLMASLIFTPLIPAAYAVIAGSRWIKVKRKTVTRQDALKEQAYLLGYERVARGKRVQNVLKGAGAGLVAGLATYLIFFNETK